MKRFLIVMCAFCALAVPALAQAAGEWDASMETPGGSAVPYKLTLKAEGEKLTGTIKSQRGEYPISGTFKGKEIKLFYTLNYNDSALPVAILGTLEGDAIKATTDINNGSFQGAWTAKRAGSATASAMSVAAKPAAASQTGSPANGAWDITMNTPQGAQNFRAEFMVEGETLKGQLKRSNAPQGLPVTGTAKGKEVSLSYNVKFQEMDLKITMTGNVEGDAIKGIVDFGGMAQDEWTAKRATADAASVAAPAPAASTAASANNISGVWEAAVETSAGSGTPTLTFQQDGEKLTGTYKGQLGEFPLTGTLKGDALEFSFKLSGQLDGMAVYKGTVSGATMKGTLDLAGAASGTFTAKKK